MKVQFSSVTQVNGEAVDQTHEALIEACGEPTTQRYQRNVELTNRALRELGGDRLAASLKERGAITEDGAIADPAIAFMRAANREHDFPRLFGTESCVRSIPFEG